MSNLFYATNRKFCNKKDIYSHDINEYLEFGSIDNKLNLNKFKNINTLKDNLKKFEHTVIFIHGFNNSFQLASRRFHTFSKTTSNKNISYLLLSWPSKLLPYNSDTFPHKKMFGYYRDRKIAGKSINLFSNFINEISIINKINLIAHSMGAWLIWNSLPLIKNQVVDNLFFIAGDLNVNIVKKQTQKYLKDKIKYHVINYSSKKDLALHFSRLLNRGVKRIGALHDEKNKIIKNIIVHDNVVKYDNYFYHTYFNNSVIVNDICDQIILNNKLPCERGLKVLKNKYNVKYWILE